MKIVDVEQGTQEWQTLRRCKITGTKLEDVMGTPLGRAQLISELIAEEATEQTKFIRPTEEMERGTNEEEFAIKLFEDQSGKKFKRGGVWLSDEYDFLAHSPDGSLTKKGHVVEAVEVKNPDSKTAIFSRLVNLIPVEETGLPKGRLPFLGVPPDYKWQCVNYFLVNPKLERLHFLIHDARFIDPKAKLYVVTIDRENPELQEAVGQAKLAIEDFRSRWVEWKEVILPTEF